ncbi:MAG: hypothetical protein JST59_00095 [Actinobacteria bacterium]|nr:hypothetical protein [Actinomycetota bacterium]
MEFDILNELLTSTVYNLFSQRTTESSIESMTSTDADKKRVKELEKLSKPEPTAGRQSANDSILSGYSGASGPDSARDNRRIPPCESVEKWMSTESTRRLKESMTKLGLDNDMLRLRNELESYLDRLSLDELVNEKQRVKSELKIYDKDFTTLFGRAPNRN